MKVLVVAEDLGVRSALTCVVKYFGWEPHGCNQHADAAVLIEQLEIDVVLVDHAMLGVDGLEVVRRIRSRNVKVPVVLMSPSERINSATMKRLAISKVIPKPPNLKGMKAALEAAASPNPDSITSLLPAGSISQEPP